MRPVVLLLILVSLFAFVAGQLLLKVAMDDREKRGADPSEGGERDAAMRRPRRSQPAAG